MAMEYKISPIANQKDIKFFIILIILSLMVSPIAMLLQIKMFSFTQ